MKNQNEFPTSFRMSEKNKKYLEEFKLKNKRIKIDLSGLINDCLEKFFVKQLEKK